MKFTSDIDYLARHYRPITLSELTRIQPYNHPAQYFALSFDDGMREVYDVIAPILLKKGIPATFFVNSTTIDNKQLMWRHKISVLISRVLQHRNLTCPHLSAVKGDVRAQLLKVRFADRHILDTLASSLEVDFNEYLLVTKPYLTTKHLLQLASAGFEIGAHSASHPCFNEIDVTDQEEQISQSVRFIRDLGLPCRSFAFPFHDNGVPHRVFEYMKSLGILWSFGSSESRVDSVEFSFQRFALDADRTQLSIPELLDELWAKATVRRLCRIETICRS